MYNLSKVKPLGSLDVVALFHASHFALQKKLRAICGYGAIDFERAALGDIMGILKEFGAPLPEGGTVLERLSHVAESIQLSGFTEKCTVEHVGVQAYRFKVEGCTFAKGVHSRLKPRDVTCLWATVMQAIFQEATGLEPRMVDSAFTDDGSETILEPMPGPWMTKILNEEGLSTLGKDRVRIKEGRLELTHGSI